MNINKGMHEELERSLEESDKRNTTVRIEELSIENKQLMEIIAKSRCEECGNEIGGNADFSEGYVICKYCADQK